MQPYPTIHSPLDKEDLNADDVKVFEMNGLLLMKDEVSKQ
jgi:hypothetical protein